MWWVVVSYPGSLNPLDTFATHNIAQRTGHLVIIHPWKTDWHQVNGITHWSQQWAVQGGRVHHWAANTWHWRIDNTIPWYGRLIPATDVGWKDTSLFWNKPICYEPHESTVSTWAGDLTPIRNTYLEKVYVSKLCKQNEFWLRLHVLIFELCNFCHLELSYLVYQIIGNC